MKLPTTPIDTLGPPNPTEICCVVVGPNRPAGVLLVDCWVVKPPFANDPVVGTKVSPAAALGYGDQVAVVDLKVTPSA